MQTVPQQHASEAARSSPDRDGAAGAAPAVPSVAPVSALARESVAERKRQLAAARRRATALLAGSTVLFVVVTAVGAHGTFLGFVQAGAEASMVGGVADWFAVTALLLDFLASL